MRPWMTVQVPVPPDRHATVSSRERAVLGSVGGELMEYHGHRLTRLGLQQDARSADLGVVAGGVRCKLAPDELHQRHPMPPMGAQQFVCRCHRANASIERRYEIGDRSGPVPGVRDNRADGRERVLNAVVKFSIQDFAGLFGSLALGDVNVHADQASRVTGLVILYETAGLDPANRSAGTHNAKLCVMLATLLGK